MWKELLIIGALVAVSVSDEAAEAPAEEKPAEEKPAEETPAEKAPAEEASKENASADESKKQSNDQKTLDTATKLLNNGAGTGDQIFKGLKANEGGNNIVDPFKVIAKLKEIPKYFETKSNEIVGKDLKLEVPTIELGSQSSIPNFFSGKFSLKVAPRTV